MNTYFEKLILASHRIENHSIDRVTDIQSYSREKTDCIIQLNHINTKEYSEPTCYIETNNKQAILLFVEDEIDTEDGILVYFTKEIFQYSDKNTILHTYKNGAYIKSNDNQFIEISRVNNMQGEVIKSDIEGQTIEELISHVFQKMNHIRYFNKFDYLEDYNIHYSKMAGHQLKQLKLMPEIDMEDIHKIFSKVDWHDKTEKTR